MARVVGHDQTVLCDRPSEVTLNDLAIPAEFRASGGRLLDQDQQKKSLDISPGVVIISICYLQKKDEQTGEILQYQEKGTEVDERTGGVVQLTRKH